MSLQMFQHQLFPKLTQILLPQGIPTAREAHETGVERIDLGLLDNFVLPPAVERAHHRDRMGDFQRSQVALDCWPRDADGRRRPRYFKLSAALAHEKLEHGVEPVQIPEAEQALDVPREK